jgi:hypothetical protein
MTPFRAQCSNCLQVSLDPKARTCPHCGSRRLVLISGQWARASRGDAPPLSSPVAVEADRTERAGVRWRLACVRRAEEVEG